MYQFKIIPKVDFEIIIPLVYDLNEGKIAKDVLGARFEEMKLQNYECAGVFTDKALIGITGLWFSTRHYLGKSIELDHVYIKPEHRGKGLGSKFMEWIDCYARSKGCEGMELNTYVQNFASHKFYYNKGYDALGYHFLRQL